MFLTVFPSIGSAKEYYYFESDNYAAITGDKFLGGATNVATGWLEIPKCIINATNEYNALFGVTGGAFNGFVNFFGRTLVGLVDIITFPIPTKVVPQPGLIWNDYDSDTTYDEVFRLRD